MWLCISKAIIASRAEERRDRVGKTSTRWACPLGLMGLKWLCIECIAPPQGLGSSAVPSPRHRALLIIPFKWNVNPSFPQFLPCQYLFDSRSAPHLFSISPPSLCALSFSIPCQLFFQLPAAVFFIPTRKCSQLRLKPLKAREFYHTKLNKSVFKNTSAVNFWVFFSVRLCVLDLINCNQI